MADKTPARSTIYAKSTAILRERHREEFDAILAEEFGKVGLAYVKRLTAEERAERDRRIAEAKAAQKVKALQEQFPDLGISLNETPF